MKIKIFCIIIIISSIIELHASEKYLLKYKPNENLKYKEVFIPSPNMMGTIQAAMIEMSSKYSITNISIREQDDGNLFICYNNKLYERKSCFNPLTYLGYIYQIENIREIIIRPSGYYVGFKTDDISMGCCLGFNLFRMNRNIDKSKEYPYIFLCYFLENEIPLNAVWKNTFKFTNKKKSSKVDIFYTLEDVRNDIAHITGNISEKLFIEGDFNIVKGHWIYYKIYYLENKTKKYLITLELI